METKNKMRTECILINDESAVDDGRLVKAAEVIREGGLVAFPTETVYGLGANALDEAASAKIYAAKGRPCDNPLIAHISEAGELDRLVSVIPEDARKLMKAFWPGPLTMVFQKSDLVPYKTTGGLTTVAVRMPSHPTARALIRLAGVPIAAPSANTSGRPSPTTAEHVRQDMDGKIEMIIDGGPVGIGLESTIVDVSGEEAVVLRPGAITREMVCQALGKNILLDPAITGPIEADIKPKAPGMKYRHYAPKAELTLVEGESSNVAAYINEAVRRLGENGRSVGIICTDETFNQYPAGVIRSIGERARQETIAHNLYGVLREFDDRKVDAIFSESFSDADLGQAIMNRLTKAAGYHITKV